MEQGARNVTKKFLGWQRMPLDSASECLVETFGEDMSQVLVALPGARSGRLLLEQLARAVGKKLRPPRIVTAGALSDELLVLPEQRAGRLARTLAWATALRELEDKRLRELVARPPAADDFAAWWRLAEEVRGLFGEITAEGKRFADIADDPTLADPDEHTSREGERRRWRALALAQDKMAAQLEAAGLSDPHLSRLKALDEGRAASVGHIVLVGVVETNELLRRAIDLSSAPCTALIFAPEELADSFDAWGCLDPRVWSARNVTMPLERWAVVDRPADQARAVCEELLRWSGRYSADEITIGLGNAEVGPFIKRRLAEEGLDARDAEGVTLSTTGPVRLLEQCARFLRSRRFADFATLLRQPDFEDAVRAKLPKLDPIATLDEYYDEHLPAIVDGTWLADSSRERDVELRDAMQRVWKAASKLLDGLWLTPARTLDQWSAALRTFLEKVYGAETFDTRVEAQRITQAALEKIGATLAEIDALPAALRPTGTADRAIDLVLRNVKSAYVPAASAHDDAPTIEMLGWLELPLDNAPALIVVGFEDGHVPKSVLGDAYLPNSLRRSLRLLDEDQRLARDIYATELLLQSRPEVLFVSGRRSLSNDPQVPSRIVFHCEPGEVAPRVRRFLGGGVEVTPRVPSEGAVPELPRSATEFELKTISVTDFKTYLNSPYEYYLKRVVRVETLDDRARELDARNFGNLAHEVLQRFGEEPKVHDSLDAAVIQKFLAGTLTDLAREVYGAHPLPAVSLQIRQLEFRLRAFAEKQAERRAQGWRIRAVEWQPKEEGVDFLVDGTPVKLRGRIDRIDHRPEQRQFAVWDYKSSDPWVAPLAAHRAGNGSWRDLQLPLYCFLLPELIGDEPPEEMGYATLCRDANEIGFHSVKTWSRKKGEFETFEEGIEAAVEVAKEVVRAIRRGEFFESKSFQSRELILAAIANNGLLEQADDESEEEGA